MNKHYFWAIKIPDEIKNEINKRVQLAKAYFPFQRWVYYEDYHITLAFLGSAEEKQLEQCITLIQAAISDINSFELNINGINIFGQDIAPRVFFAEVNVVEKLLTLQKKVYDECIKAKFNLEKRKYHPHITLARKWNSEQPFSTDSLRLHNPFLDDLSFKVEEIVLYTVNKDDLPKYTPEKVFLLQS